MTKEQIDSLAQLARAVLNLKAASTDVVAWYPHSQHDGYHPGRASVRGPYGRWLMVEGGTDYPNNLNVADMYDDAKFAAEAMNQAAPMAEAILSLLETLKKQEAVIEALSKYVEVERAVPSVGRALAWVHVLDTLDALAGEKS